MCFSPPGNYMFIKVLTQGKSPPLEAFYLAMSPCLALPVQGTDSWLFTPLAAFFWTPSILFAPCAIMVSSMSLIFLSKYSLVSSIDSLFN